MISRASLRSASITRVNPVLKYGGGPLFDDRMRCFGHRRCNSVVPQKLQRCDFLADYPALLFKYGQQATLDPFGATGRATLNLLTDLVAAGAISSASVEPKKRSRTPGSMNLHRQIDVWCQAPCLPAALVQFATSFADRTRLSIDLLRQQCVGKISL